MWATVLMACSEWGIPPWEIAPEIAPLEWMARWTILKEAMRNG